MKENELSQKQWNFSNEIKKIIEEKDQYYYEELAVICEFYHLKEMIVNDDYMDKMIDIWSK